MDWFTWLSKTDLDPSVVYEYALTFTHNELVEEDVVYFSHEFLQSMGVDIAKHRLEILKLARKHKGSRIHPVLWLMFVLKQTKNYVIKHVQTLVHRDSTQLSLVPKRNHSLRWKVSMLQRNKRLRAPSAKTELWPRAGHDSPMFVSDDGVLMLTNGSPIVDSRSSGSTRTSGWVESEDNGDESCHFARDPTTTPCNGNFSRTPTHSPEEEEYRSSNNEEIKWDSMFKNLNPT